VRERSGSPPDTTHRLVASAQQPHVQSESRCSQPTNTVTKTLTVGDRPVSVAVSPDGTRAYVTNYYDGTVSVLNVSAQLNSVAGQDVPANIMASAAQTSGVSDVVSGLWGLLAWVRREVQRTFFNQAPTISYDPALNSQAVDGVVTGDLNAADPDGDALSLSVVEAPKYGTVVINRDGTFTYTPDPEFARTGGTDEFTVMAADTGLHLHGPWGVFAPDFGHSDKTVVEVSVDLVKIKTPSMSVTSRMGWRSALTALPPTSPTRTTTRCR
jgi:YVTN family beta-propeller protein